MNRLDRITNPPPAGLSLGADLSPLRNIITLKVPSRLKVAEAMPLLAAGAANRRVS